MKDLIFAACGILIRNACLDKMIAQKLVVHSPFWDALNSLCHSNFKDQRRDAISILSNVALHIDQDCKLKDKELVCKNWITVYYRTIIDGLSTNQWVCMHTLLKLTAPYANHSAFVELPECMINSFIGQLIQSLPTSEEMNIYHIVGVYQSMPNQNELPQVFLLQPLILLYFNFLLFKKEWYMWELTLMLMSNLCNWESQPLLAIFIKYKHFNRNLILYARWSTIIIEVIEQSLESLRLKIMAFLPASVLEQMHNISLKSIMLLKIILYTTGFVKDAVLLEDRLLVLLYTSNPSTLVSMIDKTGACSERVRYIGLIAAECLS